MEFMVNGKISIVENTAAESSAEDPETGLGMTGTEQQYTRT